MDIAILGHGTVGSGVVEVFEKSRENIRRKTGRELSIKYILDVRDFSSLPYGDRFVKDFSVIANDPGVGIVVECIGGLTPAYSYVRECLSRGKSVVTSNKELVAEKGAELLALAAERNVNFLFEASVGGGIPIIRPLHQCLNAGEITGVAGILNGTTNYILTKMYRDKASFADALALAQQLGYAERDPSADVLGQDACRKICILASLAFGKSVYPADVPTEGITGVTGEDVEYASGWGGAVKLIAGAERLADGRVAVGVAPMFVPGDCQLSGVSDVYNGILVRGDTTGDVLFYGRGAGKLPTASSVISDVIDAAKADGTIKTLSWKDAAAPFLVPADELPARRYVRFTGGDAGVFAGAEKLWRPGAPGDETALITQPLTGAELLSASDALGSTGGMALAALRVFA